MVIGGIFLFYPSCLNYVFDPLDRLSTRMFSSKICLESASPLALAFLLVGPFSGSLISISMWTSKAALFVPGSSLCGVDFTI